MGLFFQSRLGLERELAERRLVHVPLDTPQPVYSELGVYVRSGRSLPPALDAFIQIASELIAHREAQEQHLKAQKRVGLPKP